MRRKGGLRLDTLATDLDTPTLFAVWVQIHDRLQAGEMPPQESPQPATDERREVVQWIGMRLAEADVARRQLAGHPVLRRLNLTEYENTFRDLLSPPGLPLRGLLPEDGRAYGYDKSGDELELSHVQIAKYMEAADLALSVATATQVDAMEVQNRRIYPTQRNGFRPPLGNGEAVLLKDFKLDLVEPRQFPYGAIVPENLFEERIGFTRHREFQPAWNDAKGSSWGRSIPVR